MRAFFFFLRILGFSFLLFFSANAFALDYPDQGSAYAGCLSDTAAYLAVRNSPRDTGELRCGLITSLTYRGEFETANSAGARFWAVARDHSFPSGQSCSARPALTGGMAIVGSAGTSCTNGCVYGIGGSGAGGIAVTIGEKTYATLQGAMPTGSVCSGQTAPAVPEAGDCQQIGNLTQCAKANGQHCVVASSGRQICWNPGEAGTKSSGNEGATKAPANASINPPGGGPANGGDWQPGGSGTVSTTAGNVTTNYNVQTWVSSYGSQGDGTPDGSGGEGEEGDGVSVSGDGVDCAASNFQCSDMASVECNQLIQTWYLRCRGVDLTGGDTCESEPVCKGNASDCFISRSLWLMRCDGTDRGDGGSDAIGVGQAEIVSGEGDGTEEPDMSGISTADSEIGDNAWIEKNPADLLGQLDASGFAGGGQCPQLPSFSVGGGSHSISLEPMCDMLRSAGVLVLALAYWLAFRIIAGNR